MKKSDFLFHVASAALFIAVIAAVIYKLLILQPGLDSFRIKKSAKIELTGLDGSILDLTTLINKDKDTCCLFFELNNSESSITRGLEELKRMQDAGKKCIITAVHDSLDEVRAWSTMQKFSPVYFIEDIDFYRNFYCVLLPVIVKIKKGKVKEYKHYTLNGGTE